MLSILLISIFSLLFLASFAYIIKRDYLFGLFYFFLFVYTIFTQIGYTKYPEVVIAYKAYFGQEIFFDYWLFINLSFITIFLTFFLFRCDRQLLVSSVEKVKKDYRSPFRIIMFYTIVFVFNVTMIYLFLSYYESTGYVGEIIPNKLLAYGYFTYPGVIMVLYIKLRRFSINIFERIISFIFLLISIIIFSSIGIRAGQRSQFVALAVAVTSYMFLTSPFKFSKKIKSFVKVFPFILLILIITIVLSDLRLRLGYVSPLDFIQLFQDVFSESISAFFSSIIFQDYFSPSLLLFGSIYYEFVNPAEVIKSNILNSFVFIGYPTLAETVGKLLNPEVSRKHGYAYYILIEGYNFAGWFGILYNALVIFVGFSLWRRLFLKSSDKEFNNFMIAYMASLLIQIVRGQSVYFIRYIYLHILPIALLYYLALGYKPTFFRYWIKKY
jgi:hypothetical protein